MYDAYEKASQKIANSYPECATFTTQAFPEMDELTTPSFDEDVPSLLKGTKTTILLMLKAKCMGMARGEVERQKH